MGRGWPTAAVALLAVLLLVHAQSASSSSLNAPSGFARAFNDTPPTEFPTEFPTEAPTESPPDPNCIPCPTGFIPDPERCDCAEPGTCYEGLCSACEEGFYAPEPGSSVCTPCDAGSYQPDAGQASCILCEPGTEQPDTNSTYCALCDPGQVAPANGTISCTTCWNGTISPDRGGVNCTECDAGSTSKFPFTKCDRCTPGSYCPDVGCEACIQCTPGYAQDEYGMDHCYLCPAGTYTERFASAMCVGCGAGYYSSVVGSNSSDTCVPCPPGYYCPSERTAAPSPCPENSICPGGSAQHSPCGSLHQASDNNLLCSPGPWMYVIIALGLLTGLSGLIVLIAHLRRNKEEAENNTESERILSSNGPTYSGL